jgi:hypothetical protein
MGISRRIRFLARGAFFGLIGFDSEWREVERFVI